MVLIIGTIPVFQDPYSRESGLLEPGWPVMRKGNPILMKEVIEAGL